MVEQIQKAIAAIKAKDYKVASEILWAVIDEDPFSDDAYYWLSLTTDSVDEKRQFLEQAIIINQHNVLAARSLAKLGSMVQRREDDVDDTTTRPGPTENQYELPDSIKQPNRCSVSR